MQALPSASISSAGTALLTMPSRAASSAPVITSAVK